MNSLDALNAITRRALRINYQSPPVCLPDADTASGSGSGSSGSSTLDFLPVYRKDGPTTLEATLVDGPSIALVWAEVAEAYVYLVYRSTTAEGPWIIIGNGIQAENYLDETPGAGTYYFKVTAIEPDAGETYPSPIAGPITI